MTAADVILGELHALGWVALVIVVCVVMLAAHVLAPLWGNTWRPR